MVLFRIWKSYEEIELGWVIIRGFPRERCFGWYGWGRGELVRDLRRKIQIMEKLSIWNFIDKNIFKEWFCEFLCIFPFLIRNQNSQWILLFFKIKLSKPLILSPKSLENRRILFFPFELWEKGEKDKEIFKHEKKMKISLQKILRSPRDR